MKPGQQFTWTDGPKCRNERAQGRPGQREAANEADGQLKAGKDADEAVQQFEVSGQVAHLETRRGRSWTGAAAAGGRRVALGERVQITERV